MGAILYRIGQWLLGEAIGKALFGAGLGLVSSQIILTLINTYINKAIAGLSFGSSKIVMFLGLSGTDVAISVLVGALIARATIEASKIGLKKLTA